MNGQTRLRMGFNVYNRHCKMEYVWIDSGISQHLNPFNISIKYDEWLEKVEIGIWALKWSPQDVFESPVGSKLAYLLSTFDTKIE
eukprot:scaffold53743_cov37-Cyclotella_meneghiniana.AAC.2